MKRTTAIRLLGAIIGLFLIGLSYFSTPAFSVQARNEQAENNRLPELSLPFLVESEWNSVPLWSLGINLETNQDKNIRFGISNGKFKPGSEDDTWFVYGWFGSLEAITKPYNIKYPIWENRHNGIDFAGKLGLEVSASTSGKVIFAGKKIGNTVVVDIGNGYQITYGHLQDINVKKGEWVQSGNLLGHLGNTGTTNPHLHFQVDLITKYNRTAINPVPLLDAEWGNVIIPEIDANQFYIENQNPLTQSNFSW